VRCTELQSPCGRHSKGNANETDCIFKLREKVRDLAFQMMELEAKMPPVLDKDETSENNQRKGRVLMKVKEFAEQLKMEILTGEKGLEKK